MEKHVNRIAIAISSLALLFLSGCTQAEWDQFWAEHWTRRAHRAAKATIANLGS